MKIAIVANGPLTRAEAPFKEDWEMWGIGYPVFKLNWQDRFDKIFEIHDREFDKEYEDWMKKNSVLRRADLPFEDMRRLSEPDGFDSSMSIMIAYAILQNPTDIGVWGIDARIMDEEEYRNQWPNILWLLGIARGCGIRLTCPPRSGLFTNGDYK